jgi:hypothetical protein
MVPLLDPQLQETHMAPPLEEAGVQSSPPKTHGHLAIW